MDELTCNEMNDDVLSSTTRPSAKREKSEHETSETDLKVFGLRTGRLRVRMRKRMRRMRRSLQMGFKRKRNILIGGSFGIERVEARRRNGRFGHAAQRQSLRTAAADAVDGVAAAGRFHAQRAEELRCRRIAFTAASQRTRRRRQRLGRRRRRRSVVAARRAVARRRRVAHLTRRATAGCWILYDGCTCTCNNQSIKAMHNQKTR